MPRVVLRDSTETPLFDCNRRCGENGDGLTKKGRHANGNVPAPSASECSVKGIPLPSAFYSHLATLVVPHRWIAVYRYFPHARKVLAFRPADKHRLQPMYVG